jgi:hypothetical protein
MQVGAPIYERHRIRIDDEEIFLLISMAKSKQGSYILYLELVREARFLPPWAGGGAANAIFRAGCLVSHGDAVADGRRGEA